MIGVRLATFEDSNDIFEWRNDSHTRQMSHNTKAVEREEHKSWFEATLKNSNRCLLVCNDENGEKVGVVRFDIEINVAKLSINLNPNVRGRGLAKKCLNEAIRFVRNAYPKLKFLKAKIKNINIASRKTFEGIGFEFEVENDGVRHYKILF